MNTLGAYLESPEQTPRLNARRSEASRGKSRGISNVLVALLLVGCATTGPAPEPAPVAQPAPAAKPPEPPPPVDPATVTDGDITVGWVNGMQVIVKSLPNAELVAGRLIIKGGVRNWNQGNAGIEQLALAVASSGGTESLDKDAFARRLAGLGSAIGASAGDDFSGWFAKSLKENWDPTFALLVDAFTSPALPESEIQVQKARQISGLKHEMEEPDAHLALLVHETLFKGHPYANRAVGTIESVEKLTRQQLVDHLAGLRQDSRLMLVVVGSVDPMHVLAQAQASFASLPRGNYIETPLPPVHFDKANLTVVEQQLPTNYIEGTFMGPGWRDADFPAAVAAAQQLRYREFEEVRTKRNLSYAPAAYYAGATDFPHGALYVTAVDPNTTIQVMYDEARRLQAETVSDKDLAGDKSVFLTGFLMANEATDGQADLLAKAQIYGGDWRLSRTLPEKIRNVSSAEVQAFAKKYIANLQVVVLGDPSKIDKSLFESL
jgi:zinc protease